MSSLGYAAGGFGQGMAQGKEFKYKRQMQQADIDLRKQGLAQAKDAQDYQKFKDMDDRFHDKDFETKYNPAEKVKITEARKGYLISHPDYDYGHEFTPDPNAPPTPNPNGLPNIGGQAQAGPVIPPAPDQPGSNNFGPGADGSQMNPSVSGAPPVSPVTAPPPASPPAAPQIQQGTPRDAGLTPEMMNNLLAPADPNFGSLSAAPTPAAPAPPVGQPTAPVAPPEPKAIDPFVQQHDALMKLAENPNLSPDQKQRYQQDAAAALIQGAVFHHTNEQARLAGVQADIAPGQAAVQNRVGTAQATGMEAHNPNIAALDAAELAGRKATTKATQFETNVAGPEKLRQGQEGIDVARSGQAITKMLGLGNLQVEKSRVQNELNQYHLTWEQWQATKKGLLATQAKSMAEAEKLQLDPDFNTQVLVKALEDSKYITSPSGVKTPGPTFQAATDYENRVKGGVGPTLTGNQLGSPVRDPGAVQSYLAGTQDDPATQVSVLKSMGYAPPPGLAARAAAYMKTGGGNRGRK